MNRIVAAVARRIRPIWYARKIGVTVGERCRLINVTYSTEPYLISLGDHVSATSTRFETHDGGVWAFRDEHPKMDIIKPIRVGSNVYFGHGCIVLPGVTVGDNVIVGAGSVVTRDIPSGTVCAGVPARPIKSTDEYFEKASQTAIDTKHMSREEKRAYLLELYSK